MLPNFNRTCNFTTLSAILGTTLILHPYGNWALTITFLMAPLFFSHPIFFSDFLSLFLLLGTYLFNPLFIHEFIWYIFFTFRYLYNETVNLQSVMTALNTLYAAHKYMCPGLAKQVRLFRLCQPAFFFGLITMFWFCSS